MGYEGRIHGHVPFDTCKCGKPGYREEKNVTRYMLYKQRVTEPVDKVMCPVGDCWHVFNPGDRDRARFIKFLEDSAGETFRSKARHVTQPATTATPSPPQRGACSKVGYGTERVAQLALAKSKEAGRAEKRAYQCPSCSMWHLSSVEQFFASDTITSEGLLSFTQAGEVISVSIGRYPHGQIANLTFSTSRGTSLRVHADNFIPLQVALASVEAAPTPASEASSDA